MGVPILPNAMSDKARRIPRRVQISIPLVSVILLLLFIQFSIVPRFMTKHSLSSQKLSEFQLVRLQSGLRRCAELSTPPIRYDFPISALRENPRWSPISGQKITVVLCNATLFDGEFFLDSRVDITFKNGVIKSISPHSGTINEMKDVLAFDLAGAYVTPGLVDMHSHHLVESWPSSTSSSDGNEVNPATGPLTPFVRALDSMKPYDLATRIIASGGITSSLILPGSGNIMGGEGFMVKNRLGGGDHGEEVVEEMLLEHGVPHPDRRRYMKMACGENPRHVYHHTRMGNAYILRQHMSRAKEMLQMQDEWCLSAAAALENRNDVVIAAIVNTKFGGGKGLPEELELDSTVAMLRGKIGVNVHCYEPEDFEDMLLHSKEFGFRIQAFHHALSAWKVPELIKESGQNITIATFAEFGLYKQEAYEANLWAGMVLAEHGVPVAYKSDHVEEETSAKYLMFQAATAHAFHLPEDLALQSVTSVPARSLELDHRVGYIRQGYDADIVVWNSHPLSVGATPIQVYIDGISTLDPKKVGETLSKVGIEDQQQAEKPRMRAIPHPSDKEDLCRSLEEKRDGKITITGIKKSFFDSPSPISSARENLTMVLDEGKLICFGFQEDCVSSSSRGIVIELQNGYVAPGLTVFSSNLGLAEVSTLEETMDGAVSTKSDVLDVENIVYAKYGIHLDGKAFGRARIGGVTRAVTAPIMRGGFRGGVSVGIKTSGKMTVLDGGIFQDDIALHFVIGQEVKASESTPTISSAIGKLRRILSENVGKDSIYGQAANGTIPVVVLVDNKYDIMQLIKLKQDHGKVNLVINGGAGASSVAAELAAAQIPVILNPFRRGPAQWQAVEETLPGPPLTKSSAQVLTEAGVSFAIAMGGFTDSHVQSLAIEAGWAAKYAGLSDRAAIDLVSRNVDRILGIELSDSDEGRDMVLYEGNPLEFGASVVLSFDGGDKSVMDCWPEAQ